jgi:hypothetical protein
MKFKALTADSDFRLMVHYWLSAKLLLGLHSIEPLLSSGRLSLSFILAFSSDVTTFLANSKD